MTRPRIILLAIVGLLAMPVVLAAGLYFAGWRPAGKPNGELLQPPRNLAAPLAATDGRALALSADHWHLAVAGTGPCADECRRLLDEARRIHVALYKQMPHVDRLWITDDLRAHGDERLQLIKLQPDLIAAQASAADRSGFDMDRPGHRIYLIDPAGRVVMRYAADANPKGVLKDMERLLRYS